MITIQDILYVRYGAPDLDRMEEFLTAFGLIRTDRTLYMRGASSSPYLHVTDLTAEPQAKSFALLAKDEDDVERLAAELGLAAEWNPEPAGGRMVRFKDPSGFDVTVLAGIRQVAALSPLSPAPGNFGMERLRKGSGVKRPRGPAEVLRLGHALLRCDSLEQSFRFYTETLGFKVSDSLYAGENLVGHFMHCGLGQTFTDHHTIAIVKRPASQFDHAGFEVLDLENVLAGNDYLMSKDYEHDWGIGRHTEGSQIFDYWRDPFGNKIEHWTDGDLVNDDYQPGRAMVRPEGPVQWGPPIPQSSFR